MTYLDKVLECLQALIPEANDYAVFMQYLASCKLHEGLKFQWAPCIVLAETAKLEAFLCILGVQPWAEGGHRKLASLVSNTPYLPPEAKGLITAEYIYTERRGRCYETKANELNIVIIARCKPNTKHDRRLKIIQGSENFYKHFAELCSGQYPLAEALGAERHIMQQAMPRHQSLEGFVQKAPR